MSHAERLVGTIKRWTSPPFWKASELTVLTTFHTAHSYFQGPTGNPRSVRAESQACNAFCVPREREPFLTAVRVPHLDGPSYEPLTIRDPSGLKAPLWTALECPTPARASSSRVPNPRRHNGCRVVLMTIDPERRQIARTVHIEVREEDFVSAVQLDAV